VSTGSNSWGTSDEEFKCFLSWANDMAEARVRNYQAGGLKACIDKWKELTSDKIIINLLQGVELEFDEVPTQWKVPKPYKFDAEKSKLIDTKIQEMLSKGIIERTAAEKGQYVSNIFTRPKKDGGIRVILDLSQLNEDIQYHHFKMESLQNALDLVTPNCYMASIDWKDAYFSVPVKKEHRKFLKFFWNGLLFQFTCLPNGLSSAPRLFTKITKVFFAALRQKGHLNSSFIDDSILVGTLFGCRRNVIDTFCQSDECGFVNHPVKSWLDPVQQRTHLGFVINSISMSVALPAERSFKIKKVAQHVLQSKSVTIREFAELIGLMVASFPAVPLGQLFYRLCDNYKNVCLKRAKGDYGVSISLNSACKQDIQWWIDNVEKAAAPIRRKAPDLELTSDASMIGWGGTLGKKQTGGNWSSSEALKHINELELLAAYFTVKAFCQSLSDVHLLLRIDNTTAVCYINHMGGRADACNEVARQMWLWCQEKNIWITASYLPGALNVKADAQSRMFHDKGDWELCQEAFNQICSFWGQPVVDLFASRLNHKVPAYFSWKPDPFCQAVDAFSVKWGDRFIYAFPPFCLMGKVLNRILSEEGRGIIVFPIWPTQHWYSILGSMLIDFPLLLYCRGHPVLSHPRLDVRNHLPKLRLGAALVSGKQELQMDFRRMLKKSSQHHGDKERRNNMMCTLRNGSHFVVEEVVIPFRRLQTR